MHYKLLSKHSVVYACTYIHTYKYLNDKQVRYDLQLLYVNQTSVCLSVGLPVCHHTNHLKIHPLRQSIVKTVDSDLRIYCYFLLVRSGSIYGFNYKTACLIMSWFSQTSNEIEVSISNLGTSAHIMCILSRRKNSITIDS